MSVFPKSTKMLTAVKARRSASEMRIAAPKRWARSLPALINRRTERPDKASASATCSIV
jgi:hypothetical protein